MKHLIWNALALVGAYTLGKKIFRKGYRKGVKDIYKAAGADKETLVDLEIILKEEETVND